MPNIFPRYQNKKRLFVYAMVCVLLLIGLVSILNMKQVLEIDRNSGKIRESWKLFGMTLKSQVSDTKFSTMAEQHVTETVPDWKIDCQFLLWGPRVSPHYRYHGAISAMETVAFGIENQTLSAEEKTGLLIQSLTYLNDFSQKDIYYEIMSCLSEEYRQTNVTQ